MNDPVRKVLISFLVFLTEYLCSRCVFVDAGVAPIDLETKRRKEEMKAREAQSRAVAEHGELALITVDNPQVAATERISLRPPMLQVIVLGNPLLRQLSFLPNLSKSSLF